MHVTKCDTTYILGPTLALLGIIENVKLRSVRLRLCKMRGETDSQEILLSNLKQVATQQSPSITCSSHNQDYS